MHLNVPPVHPALFPSLPARVIGVLTAPHATFSAVVRAPRWIGMLALVAGVTAVGYGLFFQTPVGRQALLDRQVATAEAFGQTVSDARYDEMRRRLPRTAYERALAALAGIPGGAVALSGLLFVFFKRRGGTASFAQVLAVVAHSGAVLLARHLFVLPLSYVREALTSPANVGVFFPMLPDGTFVASLLGAIDLFVVWWVCILALGLAILYRRRAGPIALGLLAAYALACITIAGVKVTLGGQ
jgi:hypothetical protein